MKNRDKLLPPLVRHMLLVVFNKIQIFFYLWYTLIRPYKVKIDVDGISRYSVTQSGDSYQKE